MKIKKFLVLVLMLTMLVQPVSGSVVFAETNNEFPIDDETFIEFDEETSNEDFNFLETDDEIEENIQTSSSTSILPETDELEETEVEYPDDSSGVYHDPKTGEVVTVTENKNETKVETDVETKEETAAAKPETKASNDSKDSPDTGIEQNVSIYAIMTILFAGLSIFLIRRNQLQNNK